MIVSVTASALPRKGFQEGPFLTLAAGVTQFDWDINQRLRVQEGESFEPTFGLGFGWNVQDWWAPEMQFRYATDSNNGRREHIVAVNTGVVFSWVTEALTDVGKWHIFPFVRPGIGYQLATLPGDPLSGVSRLLSHGIGPSIAGGVRFIYKTYLYLGIQVQEDFLWHDSHHQVLPGLGNTLIYDGGLGKQFEVFTLVGVHY